MDIFQKKTYILGCRKGNKLKNKLPKKKSRAFKCPVPAYMLSHFSRVRFFATPWTVARQAPLSVEFSRQECWNGLVPSSRGSSRPRDQIASLICVLASWFFTTSATWEALIMPQCQTLLLLLLLSHFSRVQLCVTP